MEELVNIIVNNGVAVACVLYFMHFNSTTLKSLTDTGIAWTILVFAT